MEMQATPIPLELVAPFFAINIFGKSLYGLLAHLTIWWPTFLGYQFVAKARKLK